MRTYILIFWLCLVTGILPAQQTISLFCEYKSQALDIDVPNPRLSWEPAPCIRPIAYEVKVATDPGFEKLLWQSGKQAGSPVYVKYQGIALASYQRYYWAVRLWDEKEGAGDWEVSGFETSALKPEEWKAPWIAAHMPDTPMVNSHPAKWIGRADSVPAGTEWVFRRRFSLADSSTVSIGTGTLASTDSFTLFLNGRKVSKNTNPKRIFDLYLRSYLREGSNIIEIYWKASRPNVPAILFSLNSIQDNGFALQILTDKHWEMKPGEADYERARILGAYSAVPWAPLPQFDPPPRSLLFQTSFSLSQEISRARLYITGLGTYKAWLNASSPYLSPYPQTSILAPGWTDYRKRLHYQVIDLGPFVKEENELFVLLGNGWWSGGLGWQERQRYSRGPLCLSAQILLEYQDGSREWILSDKNWESSPSFLERNSIYGGERYVFDLQKSSSPCPVQEIVAPVPILSSNDYVPIVWQRTDSARYWQKDSLSWIYDFGTNESALLQLPPLTAPVGSQIQLRHAEFLTDDSSLNIQNLRSATAKDELILEQSFNTAYWQALFTYHGFRYAEVQSSNPLQNPEIRRLVYSAAVRQTGRFTSASPVLNQIHDNTRRSISSNLLSIPTDCPQRDERLGWLGDAQVMIPSMCYQYDMRRFMEKWLQDIADGQDSSGYVYDAHPPMVVKGAAKPGWGDAILIIPWNLWEFYGDTSLLERFYPNMQAWVEYMITQTGDSLYRYRDAKGFAGFGDWVSLEESDKDLIAQAYYYRSLDLMGRIAGLLERHQDVFRYNMLALLAKINFHLHYRTEEGYFGNGTQAEQVLPLAFGMVPDTFTVKITEYLAESIVQRDTHLTTGFLGTAHLLPVLSENGYHDLAYALARQRTYPSWGYMIDQGATSLWERWDCDQIGPLTNSRNHYALGSITAWLYGYLGGIQALPGSRRIRIAPMPVKKLADCTASALGVEVRWSWDAGAWVLEIQAGAAKDLEVVLPDGITTPQSNISINGIRIVEKGKTVPDPKRSFIILRKNTHWTLNLAGGTYSIRMD